MKVYLLKIKKIQLTKVQVFKKLLQQNNELNDKIIKKDKIIDDLKKNNTKLEENHNNLIIENNTIKENIKSVLHENNNLNLNISLLQKEKLNQTITIQN